MAAYLPRDHRHPDVQPDGNPNDEKVSVPGLVAAAVWAVAFVAGICALLAGHAMVGTTALVVAVMAPWFGLAWVGHTRRRETHDTAERTDAHTQSPLRVALQRALRPGAWYRPGPTSRPV